jgi:hypothetical protein
MCDKKNNFLICTKTKSIEKMRKNKCIGEQDKIPSVIKIRDINSCQY